MGIRVPQMQNMLLGVGVLPQVQRARKDDSWSGYCVVGFLLLLAFL